MAQHLHCSPGVRVPVLVVEPCSHRWAHLRAQLEQRGCAAMAVRSGRESAAVLDVANVSVLVVPAVGSLADHREILVRLRADPALRVLLVSEAFSPEVLSAYAVFGPQVVMAQTDPAAAVAWFVSSRAPDRAA